MDSKFNNRNDLKSRLDSYANSEGAVKLYFEYCHIDLTSTTSTNNQGTLQFAHEDASLSVFRHLF